MGTSILLDILRQLNVEMPAFLARLPSHPRVIYLSLVIVVFLIAANRYSEPIDIISGN